MNLPHGKRDFVAPVAALGQRDDIVPLVVYVVHKPAALKLGPSQPGHKPGLAVLEGLELLIEKKAQSRDQGRSLSSSIRTRQRRMRRTTEVW